MRKRRWSILFAACLSGFLPFAENDGRTAGELRSLSFIGPFGKLTDRTEGTPGPELVEGPTFFRLLSPEGAKCDSPG